MRISFTIYMVLISLALSLGARIACQGVTLQAKMSDDPGTKLMTNLLAQESAAASVTNRDGPVKLEDQVLPEVDRLLSTLENKGTNLPAHEQELAYARQLRLEKNLSNATRILMSLLQKPLPDEFRRRIILELAYVAQADQQPLKALRLLSYYLEKYPEDDFVPEVLLRQGLIYREVGASGLALNKLYAVMTKALNLKSDRLDYYQQVVLQAQTEIAETHYAQGQFTEAADFFSRLLKMDNPALHKTIVHFKLLRCLASSGQLSEMVPSAEKFLNCYPDASEVPEVRFLLVRALKQLGRNQEALQQVLALLEGQKHTSKAKIENWAYWQQRTGNEIANQLYKEGDFLNALQVYSQMAQLNTSAEWQLPVWYQIGLVYERLQQPQRATEVYGNIIGRQKDMSTNAFNPSLQTVCEMAHWRKDFLAWHLQAEKVTRDLTPSIQPRASGLLAQ
jgi:tetratricopeptide (TPR) repeat protein